MKDETPQTNSPQQGLPPTRRNFSVVAIHGLWAAMVAALGLPAIGYLLIPAKFRRKNDFVEAGDITQLTPQMPLEVAFRRNRVDGWRVVSEKSTAWVVKFAENNVVAYAPQCTHLGCAYHWDQRRTRFVCPCHNSVFSLDGKVQEGPAPRPLDRYQTKVEGGKLLLGPVQQAPSQTV
ncbi:MAG TPA: ubiquinol-cytochrome c reductase iron-sulfur subunit [Bryobacteraceae bacterium]